MNYYCKYVEPSLQGDWERVVMANKASGFHQSFEWAQFKNVDGWDTYKIGLFDKKTDELVGGSIVLQFNFSNGTDFFYIPEGPILDYGDEKVMMAQWKVLFGGLEEIIGVSDRSQTTHLRIEPRTGDRPSFLDEKFIKAPLNLQPKYTQVIDLSVDEDGLLTQMKQKGRYNVRLAEKKGVKIVSRYVDDRSIQDFFEIYDQTFSRKKLEKKDLAFFERLMGECKSIGKLYFAEYDGKKLATEFVVYYGDRATYLYGASLDRKSVV